MNMHPTTIVFTLIGSLALASALAADAAPELLPRCGGPFMLCGYVEKGSEAERIPRRFEVAKPFSEGLAAVRIEGRYGYIDTSGKVVIAPRFQSAGPFAGKYAEILMQDGVGIINRSGKIVVAPGAFARIIPFHGDTFVAKPFPNGRKPDRGRRWRPHDVRLDAITGPAVFSSYNDSGLFHAQKGWLTEQNLRFYFFDKQERGLIWAGTRNENYSEIYGLMRSDGTWQVSPRYGSVQQLWGRFAIVESVRDFSLPPEQRDGALRSGAVDRDGNLVIPLKFPFLSFGDGNKYGFAMDARPDYSSGKRSGGREAIVRPDGSLLANRYFDKVEVDEDGKLPRGRIGTIWYSIEPNGRMIPDDAERLLLECPGGLRIVDRGETVEFRGPGKSQPIGPFDKGYFTKSDCPGPFSARRNGKWFMVSGDGSVLGGKNGFEAIHSFSGQSHTAVKLNGKWGIIDRSGTFTVQPSFDILQPTGKGSFTVNEHTDPYWIDAYGKRVEKPPQDILPWEQRTLTCPGGLRFFEQAGLWGLQDPDGKTVIAPRFRALSCFGGGITWVAAPDGKAWCPIDPNGQRHEAMECQENYYPHMWTESVPESFSADTYESSVLWNRAWLDYHAGKRAELPGWVSRFRR
jgi:hypothetical protein